MEHESQHRNANQENVNHLESLSQLRNQLENLNNQNKTLEIDKNSLSLSLKTNQNTLQNKVLSKKKKLKRQNTEIVEHTRNKENLEHENINLKQIIEEKSKKLELIEGELRDNQQKTSIIIAEHNFEKQNLHTEIGQEKESINTHYIDRLDNLGAKMNRKKANGTRLAEENKKLKLQLDELFGKLKEYEDNKEIILNQVQRRNANKKLKLRAKKVALDEQKMIVHEAPISIESAPKVLKEYSPPSPKLRQILTINSELEAKYIKLENENAKNVYDLSTREEELKSKDESFANYKDASKKEISELRSEILKSQSSKADQVSEEMEAHANIQLQNIRDKEAQINKAES